MIEGEDLELFERSVRDATDRHTGEALDAALQDVGWREALSFDRRAAVSRLFELQGEAGATSSALDHVVASALGHELDGTTGVAFSAIGTDEPPGRFDGERIALRGIASVTRPSTLVVARTGDREQIAAIVKTSSLDVRPVRGVDPWLSLVELSGEVGVNDPQPAYWVGAVLFAQLAIAHELVGASRKALTLAREHALDRIQFGQPIARFQAVRHRLAETLVAIETASAVLDAAWLDLSPVTAAMAKATAGRSARTAARHCQQVLAGIGFTTEHDLHRYVRRILALDQLFGSHAVLTKRLGEDLLVSRTLPRLVPL
jgi:Acyl-CoA dehydrogenase, C-terminal domain